MMYLKPLLILVNCLMIQGILEWTVTGKVTDYGQNVTLLCHVPNCCPKDSGWDRWTPHQRTLFIDVKTGRPNKKYDGKVLKDGYTLIIQNLTKNDLNVSYSCLYGVTLGERKFLMEEDVFTYITQQDYKKISPGIISTDYISKEKIADENGRGAIITGITMVIVLVSMFICFGIKRHKNQELIKNSVETEKLMNPKQIESIPMTIKDIIENPVKTEKSINTETEQKESILMKIEGNEENIKQRVSKIEIEQREVIPPNIRELTKNQIEEWEKKDMMFVSTRASDYVMKRLQDKSCLTLTGSSGVGKSFIARHAALFLKKKGYNILPVYSPTDMRDYYQPGKQTVFIVDDICGNFTANQQQVENWKQMLPVINTVIADKCCKIIVSCRLQVYKDDKFNILSPFKSCECNLISDKLCLTSVEKTNIAKTYIDTSIADIDDLSSKLDFFPLLCSLYHEKENVDIKEYFKNPFDVYKRELDRLSEHGDEGNYKICSLALCVLFNNHLEEKWFQGITTDAQRQIITETCEACAFCAIPKAKLKKALDTLDGTFICKQNGIYRTVHDKLFDFLAHYFGQNMIGCLIVHGDFGLVHQRFSWQTSPDDKKSDIDFIIKIPDDYLESYLKRFIMDWSAEKVHVFSSNNMTNPSFRQQLLQYLQQLEKTKQVTLVNTKNTVLPKEDCGSGTTPLMYYCYFGYSDMVQWALRNDVDVDQSNDNGVTGLYFASQNGHTNLVKLLLEKDSKVDLCVKDGCSPLHIASQNGHTDIVKLLLERNPNADLCDKDDNSPLLLASNNGHTDIVRLLLEKDSKVDLCTNDGCSPLHMASQRGNTDIVKLLLERNPNADLCDKDGNSPLLLASNNGHTDIVKLLLERNPNADLCDKDGNSPLLLASNNGHTDIVKLLLERNPNADLCDKDGNSPLLLASNNGHTDIVKLLLERNPNADLCDKGGTSPLLLASRNGHTDIVKLLLEKDSKVDLSDNSGFTPLICACSRNFSSIVHMLIKHKPDINAQSYDGCNALMFSVLSGNLDITKLLLENNADCNICAYGKQYVINALTIHPWKTLDTVKQSTFDRLVKEALPHVADYVSKKSVDYVFDVEAGCSPLHFACFNGRIDVVGCLLDHNAEINITKEDGITPLFFACEVGHEDIVRLLLDKGANTQIGRFDGKSPLSIATDNGHTSIVKIVTRHMKKGETFS